MKNRLRTALSIAPVTAALVIGTMGATPATAAADHSPGAARVLPSGTEQVLPDAARGEHAIDRLGDAIGDVAAINDMSVAALAHLLRTDRTIWVHPTGRLFAVDPAPSHIGTDSSAPDQAPYPYDQTFQLHSRPGSSKTIYLDFDGATVSGTGWNEITDFLLPPSTHPAFSLDADPTTFSNAERDLIQSVWQRVSEDYAPFDVDVTTADPGLEALRRTSAADNVYGTRALVTPSAAAVNTLCGGQCGGIAFLGTFDVSNPSSDYYQPAWVFPQLLGNNAKGIAEAVSHEVGHNLGLKHDGDLSDPDYYVGHGSWTPIMGAGYDRPIAQWSSGEYAGATNTEDDLTVITQNGLSVVPDDVGNTVTDATTVTSADRSSAGLITTRTDRDVFAFPQGCGGPVTVTVTPAPTSPDLDARLRLLAADGSQLAVNDPVSGSSSDDVATGMGAAATVTTTAGSTLYAEVDGVGAGDPIANGYSDYASLGRYTITATGCAGSTVGFQSATQSAAEGAGTAQLTVTRTGNTTGTSTVHYARTGGTATPGTDFTLPEGDLTFTAGQTTKTVPVAITQDTATEPDETVQVALSSPSTGTTLATSASTLTITDADAAVTGAQPELLISTSRTGSYRGDDVYNNDGSGQTITQKARRGQTRTFWVRVVNDGTETNTFTIWGSRALRGSTVKYVNNGSDVTPWMTSSDGASVELAPDQVALVRIDVHIKRTAVTGSTKPAAVMTVSDSSQTLGDVVVGMVKVVRG